MKPRSLYVLFGLLGFGLGIAAVPGVQKIRNALSGQETGGIVASREGAHLNASWSPDDLEVVYHQECGKIGNVPAEVVYIENHKSRFWIIDNVFFFDFNRDGVADAKVDTTVRGENYLRRGDQWVKCRKVKERERTAIDEQGNILTFRDVWQ